MVFEQSLSAVDPVQLAQHVGFTRIPRFRAPIPLVVRPHLLTDQLHGMNCMCGNQLGTLPPDYGSLRGLGFDPSTFDMTDLGVPSEGTGNTSVLQTVAVGTNFIPGIGQIGSVVMTTFTQFLNQMQTWFHIGAGRREADLIVPTQNSLVNQTLGGITNQILIGQNPGSDVLASLYRTVWMSGVAFQEFVLQRQFTDRRASGQALNTVMPYIDGSCGYSVPVGYTATPSQFNCLSWGDGTIGGVGTNGMLGAIGRAIQQAGGTVQALPDLHTAANQGIKLSSIPLPGGTILGVSTPMAFALGIGALLLYKKGLF